MKVKTLAALAALLALAGCAEFPQHAEEPATAPTAQAKPVQLTLALEKVRTEFDKNFSFYLNRCELHETNPQANGLNRYWATADNGDSQTMAATFSSSCLGVARSVLLAIPGAIKFDVQVSEHEGFKFGPRTQCILEGQDDKVIGLMCTSKLPEAKEEAVATEPLFMMTDLEGVLRKAVGACRMQAPIESQFDDGMTTAWNGKSFWYEQKADMDSLRDRKIMLHRLTTTVTPACRETIDRRLRKMGYRPLCAEKDTYIMHKELKGAKGLTRFFKFERPDLLFMVHKEFVPQ